MKMLEEIRSMSLSAAGILAVVLAMTGGASRAESEIPQAVAERATEGAFRVNVDQVWTRNLLGDAYGRYVGWPTLTRLRSGELVAVFSGDREGHVCPYGKVMLIRSADGGETWTKPEVVCDGPIDDRDAGLLELQNGDLVLFWFTSLAFIEYRDYYEKHPEYLEIGKKVPDEVKRRSLGSWARRSTDGGRTWSDPVRVPVMTPHGGRQLRDGRILVVGLHSSQTAGVLPGDNPQEPKYCAVAESADGGRSFREIGRIAHEGIKAHWSLGEPSFVEAPDGTLTAYFRYELGPDGTWSNRKTYPRQMLRSVSTDGGRTWSNMERAELDGFPPHFLELGDGRVLCSYGSRTPGRTGIYAAFSSDGGRSFDVADEFCIYRTPFEDCGYPSTVKLDDGAYLTVFYAYPRRGAPAALTGVKWRIADGATSACEWQDLKVNSVNRLPPRTYTVPLAREEDALTDDLEPATPYRKSLNGLWKFSWTGDPRLRVRDFWKTGFDDSSWLTIDVPSCVEMRGFGTPGYTDVKYPHAYDPKRDTHHPTIRDRDTDQPDYNPVSSYRTTFTVPESWKGRDVILRFDGVYSAYYVWVNGHKVGYAEDSKLPSEFNITEYLKVGKVEKVERVEGVEGVERVERVERVENVLAVEVYRWSDGSFVEDQDMFRYSGIFRDVTLWAKPKDGIWDFTVRTTPDGGYERWKVEVEGVGVEGMSISLYDADKKKVCDFHSTPTPNLYTSPTLAVRAWSAEDPYLYTLVVRKGDDIRMKRVGFKEQKIVGSVFTVNGQPVKFKGVNRHECSPENGRTVTCEEMLEDIRLMKRYNVNTVRTSHYPDHRLWYDLCDRYGLYVVAEANVEAHEPGYEENGLGMHPEWDHAIVERNERHVRFYRNNPCVTMWSVGNETGHGDCFRHAIAAVRKADPSRPVHWERGNKDADVDSRMYPSVEWLEKRGKLGDTGDGQLFKEAGGIGYVDNGDQSPRKCAFICEYAHAMGNSIGNLKEYWDVFDAHPSLCGGCIWEWVGHGVWARTDRVDPKTGARERYLAYGGDFDEEPHSGATCCNGIVDPLRRISAKLIEVGHVYRNLAVTPAGTEEGGRSPAFELRNKFSFTRTDAFRGHWLLRVDGVETASGSFEPPSLAPQTQGRFTVPGLDAALAASDAGAERFVDFSFTTAADAPWAGKGWCVARDQVRIGGGTWDFGRGTADAAPADVAFETDDRVVRASCGGTKAVFSRTSGTLCELVMGGKTILKDPADGVPAGPLLTCARAFVDNDRWVRDGNPWREDRKAGGFFSRGLSQLRHHVRPIAVDGSSVRIVTEVTGMKSAGFTQESTWTFGGDGSVRVTSRVKPHGTMPPALPRLGHSLKLDRTLENIRYYGRGPRENYVDRLSGSFLGVWTSTVTDQFEPYARPQDNGYKCDVRWVELTDAGGRGVRFSASEPLFVQALHYGMEDLEFARHRDKQKRFRSPPVAREEVCLNLDVRQLGLGGASCGPKPLEKYVFPIEETEWTLTMQPVGKGE